MLSKLLQRCLPWMAKGRWYHARIYSEDGVKKFIGDREVFGDGPGTVITDVSDLINLSAYVKIIDIRCVQHIDGLFSSYLLPYVDGDLLNLGEELVLNEGDYVDVYIFVNDVIPMGG